MVAAQMTGCRETAANVYYSLIIIVEVTVVDLHVRIEDFGLLI
jgi:hypothetical protein